jgi:hypothetical protein
MGYQIEGKQTLFRKGSVKAFIFEKLQEGLPEEDVLQEVMKKFEMTERDVRMEIKAVKAAKVR